MLQTDRNFEQEETSLLHTVTRWIIDVAVVIVLAVFLVQSLGNRVTVEGHSMNPTLESGDVVLVDQISYNFVNVKRFDVVIFKSSDSDKTYIKRVVGLPGETVQIKEGGIYIDNKLLETDGAMSYYTVAGLAETPIILKENEYFLVGDNGDSSEDSRFALVGNVKEEQILGRIWFRVSPFKNLGFIPGLDEEK